MVIYRMVVLNVCQLWFKQFKQVLCGCQEQDGRTHTRLWLKSRPLPTAWPGRRQIQSSPQRCTGLTGSTQAETTTTCLLLEDAEACYSAGHQVYSLEGHRRKRDASSTSSSLLGPPASYTTVFLFQVHFHHNHKAN